MNPLSLRNREERNPFRGFHQRPLMRPKNGSFFAGIARFILLIMLGSVAGIAGIVVQGYLFYTHDLPKIEILKNYAPPIVTQFYADTGELIGEFASERRFVLPIEEIPKQLQQAFIAAEDKKFVDHDGIDIEAIVRASKKNLMSGDFKEGASTITQQVAKTFLLTPEKKLTRKIKEAILSKRIEKALDKDQILHLYLNQIYLGSRAYGVEAAARTYFGKSVKDLTLAECAMLAGLAQAPSKDSPKRNLDRALKRRTYVLNRMLKDNLIDQAQYDEAISEEPKLVTLVNPYKTIAPDFTEHVRRYIEEKYGSDMLYKGGLQVSTTVDLKLTGAAQNAMERGLAELDKRQGYRGPLATLNVEGVTRFLDARTREMKEPLRFEQVVQGVITDIDETHVYVRMGKLVTGNVEREYVGKIRINHDAKWWARTPYVRPELRTRNFAEGDLPFQVGDLILVRLVDPNVPRRKLYLKKYGDKDPEMKNYREYTEDMLEYFPLELQQNPRVEAALMMRENRTGYVRVLVGGAKFGEAKFNRATQAKRQPGSSFKPVIYAAALDYGGSEERRPFTPATMILDAPWAYHIPETGEIWRPKNYGGGYKGSVSFRECLVKSRNIPTIKILQAISPRYARAYASERLGYRSMLTNNLTLALGSSAVTLEEQTNAYSVFPNRGYRVQGVYVKKIEDRNGKILEKHDPPILLDDPVHLNRPITRAAGDGNSLPGEAHEEPAIGAQMAKRAIPESTAFIMSSLLQGVVREGTAQILKKIVGRPDIAGKTGTTNGSVDAWFMGFSSDYTCGVWVGFDDEASLGDGETGGKAAAPIWGYFMKEVLAGKPVKTAPVPKEVEFRTIDPGTGLVTNAPHGVQEVFKTGSGPSDVAPYYVKKASPWHYSGSDLDQF